MKVVNKLDESYLQLIRDALHKKSNAFPKKSKGVSLKKPEKSKSLSNVSALNPHVKSKKELFKAKERLNRRAKKSINAKQATLINNCSDKNIINITTKLSKKTEKKSKNGKFNGKSAVSSVPLSKDEGSSKVLQKGSSQCDILAKTYKQKRAESKTVKISKKIYVLNPERLEDNQCESFEDISKQPQVTTSVIHKKRKVTKPVIPKCEEPIPVSLKHEKSKPAINLQNGKSIKSKEKFSKHLKKRKLYNDKLTEQSIDVKGKNEHVDILLDNCDNEEVSVKGLKFNRFCSQFMPVHNEDVIPQETQLNIPKKHFNITLNDVESDMIQSDIENETFDGITETEAVKDDIESEINSDIIETENGQKNGENVVQNTKISHHQSEDGTQSSKKKHNEILNDTTIEESSILTDDEFSSDLEVIIETSSEELNIDTEKQENKKVIKLDNNDILVFLNPGCSMHFHGLCTVEVISGEIEVLGAVLNKSKGSKKMYSPRGLSLMYIKNHQTLSSVRDIHISELEIDLKQLPEQYHNECCNEDSAVILCRDLKEPGMNFIESHVSQIIFPVEFTGPRVDFALKGVWNKLETDDSWSDVLEDVSDYSLVAIAGGKGTGKSTLLRYSVNNLLEKFPQVRVVDLDSGQSEFTAPGAISVVTVEDSLLGPNYTHFLEPDCMILCHINIGYDVKKYLQSVKYLSEFLMTLSPIPTLINFPGFTSGLGLDICLNIIQLFKPTAIIEILSYNKSKNYNINLTPADVNDYAKEKPILGSNLTEPWEDLQYEYVALNSLAEKKRQTTAWSLESRQSREISVLSYFGKLMSDNVKHLSSTDINMYSINLSSLTLNNAEGHTVSPSVINANLVVLGSLLDAESSIYSAYGFGVVRGVDLQNDTLILITPEPLEVLEKVNYLILGSVTIPPSLLMNVADVEGLVPYVSAGELVEFGQFTKRSYLPPGK